MPRLTGRCLVVIWSATSAAFAQPVDAPAPGSPDGGSERAVAPPSTVTRERSAIEDPPAERRAGFSFGIAGGLTFGNVRGYPNDVVKIGDPEFEVNTGAALSTGGVLWVGGSLADWLTLGVGTMGGGINGNGLSSTGGSIQFRIETFPLFYRGGPWRDFGLLFTAGTGGYEVERDGESVAEGAGTSVVGGGVFFEPWTLWRFSTGPSLEYAHHFSQSLSANIVVIGWRIAFYAGP